MAKEDLKPVRSKEEAIERGRKGGIRSGEVRRRKRDMKSAAKLILEMPVEMDSVKKGMKNLGFDEEDLTNQMAVMVSIWKKAMEGDVRAAEFLRDTSGQKPVDKVMVTEDDSSVEEMEKYFNERKQEGNT